MKRIFIATLLLFSSSAWAVSDTATANGTYPTPAFTCKSKMYSVSVNNADNGDFDGSSTKIQYVDPVTQVFVDLPDTPTWTADGGTVVHWGEPIAVNISGGGGSLAVNWSIACINGQ